jgi:hypothetical protein
MTLDAPSILPAPSSSDPVSVSNIPEDALMTRTQVARILGISVECLSKNRERWRERLPRVELNPRVIRYHKDAVLKLISTGHSLASPQN